MTTRPEPVRPGDRLRALLRGDDLVVAPGCFDAVSARLVAAAGFPLAYLSGATASAVLHAEPDLGHLSQDDVVALGGRVAAAADVPVLADADTGWGNPLHAARTAVRYERAGLAGLHLEDQVSPKRCGAMTGKAVVSAAEMAAKLQACIDAREALVVVARTDALAVEGETATLTRVARYAAVGVDAVFVEGMTDPAALARAHQAAGGLPLVVNDSEAHGHRLPPAPVLQEAGVRLVLQPVRAMLAAAAAVRAVLTGGSPARMSWDELTALLGLPAALEAEQHYASEPPDAASPG